MFKGGLNSSTTEERLDVFIQYAEATGKLHDVDFYKRLKHELEYLQFFISECDFGPAHEDVVALIDEAYKTETGNELPEGYGYK
jgi:hypothetical protein